MPQLQTRVADSGSFMEPAMSPDTLAKKTERSHEENQERAYIAASRRQDRSIEARIQSAHMASDIHKKRAGKSFHITEEIIRREEMYEEEEDELSHCYRQMNPEMKTESPEFNARIEAWMNNRLAMSKYMQRSNAEWNDNHINRLFAMSFPDAGKQAQDISRRLSIPGPECNGPQFPFPHSPQSSGSPMIEQPFQHQPASDTAFPPSPASSALQPGASSSTPDFSHTVNPLSQPMLPKTMPDQTMPPNGVPQAQVHPFGPGESAFTDELPPEMKQMVDITAPEANLLDQGTGHGQDWACGLPSDTGDMVAQAPTAIPNPTKPDDLGFSGFMPSGDNQGFHQPMADEPNWESFLNDKAWSYDM